MDGIEFDDPTAKGLTGAVGAGKTWPGLSSTAEGPAISRIAGPMIEGSIAWVTAKNKCYFLFLML